MILICYDGSADAKATIEHGAQLLNGQPATVLTVWQPFIELLAHSPSGFGLVPGIVDTEEIDKAARQSAEERAEEGAELARGVGFDAQPRTCSHETTTSEAILVEAEAIGAEAILIGSRGLTGLKSLLLGSVSHGVIQHADRAVIVVPSPEVAASRARGRQAIHESQ
jgi:nucleotide-binding universal stress UspA family protein